MVLDYNSSATVVVGNKAAGNNITSNTNKIAVFSESADIAKKDKEGFSTKSKKSEEEKAKEYEDAMNADFAFWRNSIQVSNRLHLNSCHPLISYFSEELYLDLVQQAPCY